MTAFVFGEAKPIPDCTASVCRNGLSCCKVPDVEFNNWKRLHRVTPAENITPTKLTNLACLYSSSKDDIIVLYHRTLLISCNRNIVQNYHLKCTTDPFSVIRQITFPSNS